MNEPDGKPAEAPDYVEAALDLLGGEDTEFAVHVDRDAAVVMLSCEYNGCKWGYTIGEIPLWELDDPLLYLLVHQDCDGVIHPEQGAMIAVRLKELLPLMRGEDDWYRNRTQQFIDGLLAAAAANQDVDFH